MEKCIIDKDFGHLTYLEMPNGDTYWTGLTLLRNYKTDIHFRAHDVYCPTINQREFFRQIEKTYLELISKIYDVLPNKMKEDKQLAESLYFSEHFIPKAILIPGLEIQNRNWSMTLQSTVNKKHFLVVEFDGFVPKKSFLEK
jgi:hypothetical protein